MTIFLWLDALPNANPHPLSRLRTDNAQALAEFCSTVLPMKFIKTSIQIMPVDGYLLYDPGTTTATDYHTSNAVIKLTMFHLPSP